MDKSSLFITNILESQIIRYRSYKLTSSIDYSVSWCTLITKSCITVLIYAKWGYQLAATSEWKVTLIAFLTIVHSSIFTIWIRIRVSTQDTNSSSQIVSSIAACAISCWVRPCLALIWNRITCVISENWTIRTRNTYSISIIFFTKFPVAYTSSISRKRKLKATTEAQTTICVLVALIRNFQAGSIPIKVISFDARGA